jgi:hypothetical protein
MTDTTPAMSNDDSQRVHAYWDWKARAKCFGEREAFDAGWQARAALSQQAVRLLERVVSEVGRTITPELRAAIDAYLAKKC